MSYSILSAEILQDLFYETVKVELQKDIAGLFKA
jgi:hypothetical protein